MSLGNVFSSSGKQAQQAASAEQGIAQNTINQVEGYTNQQEQALRNALAGIGPNPYFSAAQQLTTQPYAVNPHDTVTFGTAGPGVMSAAPTVASNVAARPIFPGAFGQPAPLPQQQPPEIQPPGRLPPNPNPTPPVNRPPIERMGPVSNSRVM